MKDRRKWLWVAVIAIAAWICAKGARTIMKATTGMSIEEIQFPSYSIHCKDTNQKQAMTIRIFAVDMDGTCLNSHNRIDPETIVMLYRAKQAGIEIVPTTGRSLSCLPHQLLPLTDLYRYIISSNGAVITDTETGKDIYNAPVSYTHLRRRRCTSVRIYARFV